MPEGPEVRREAQNLSNIILGTKLTEIAIVSGRYLKAPVVGASLINDAQVRGVRNHGKLIIIEAISNLNEPMYIHSTLGMTGWWAARTSRYERFELRGDKVVKFHDPRNFGTIKVVDQDGHDLKIRSLGPDYSRVTLEGIDELNQQTMARIQRFGSKQTIGQALLDQRIFCGIGNYLRADALYLTGLSPHDNAKTLDSQRLEALIMNCALVSTAAYQGRSPIAGVNGQYHNVAYGMSKSPNGNRIIAEQIDKRSIWWCPAEQT